MHFSPSRTALSLVFIFVTFGSLSAQQTQQLEIYNTEREFLANKPTEVISVHKFKMNSVENLRYIQDGKEQTIKFGEISGYSIDGIRYRAYGKRKVFTSYGYFKIEDDSCIVTYSRKNRHRKGGGPMQDRFYSKDLSSPIYHIWLGNLKKDFPNNPAFINNVKPFFKGNYAALYSKNEETGMVRLNELYCKTFH